MSKNKDFGLWSLLPYFLPYKKKASLAFLSLFITSVIILFFGKAIKYLIDYGFDKTNPHLNLMIIIVVLTVFVLSIAGYYRSFLINSVAESIINDIKQKLYSHILTFSPDFFTNVKTGEIISRLTVDTTLIYNVISNNISFFLRNSVLFIGGLLLLFFTNVKLSLLAFLVILLAILPIIFIGKMLKKVAYQTQNAIASVSAHIEESLNGIQTIQAYLCENREIANFNQQCSNVLQSSLQKIHLRALLVAFVIAISFGAVSEESGSSSFSSPMTSTPSSETAVASLGPLDFSPSFAEESFETGLSFSSFFLSSLIGSSFFLEKPKKPLGSGFSTEGSFVS